MGENLTEEDKKRALKLYEDVDLMLKLGYERERIKEKLAQSGIPADGEDRLINIVATSRRANASKPAPNVDKDQYTAKMIWGAIWCIGGIIVTVISYAARANVGVYVVAWGAILWGLIDFIRGLIGYISK